MLNRDLLVATCISFMIHAGIFFTSFSISTTLSRDLEGGKIIDISLSEVSRPKPLLPEPGSSPKKAVKVEDKRIAGPMPEPQSQPHQSQPQSEPKITPPTEIPSPSKETINGEDTVSRKEEIKEGNETYLKGNDDKGLHRPEPGLSMYRNETYVNRDNNEGTDRGRMVASTIGGWHVSGGDPTPSYLENPKPIYPMIAIMRKMEGVVSLRVEVLADGGVGKIEIKSSSGYRILDESALNAVKKWRFLPATLEGVSVKVWASIPIRFELVK